MEGAIITILCIATSNIFYVVDAMADPNEFLTKYAMSKAREDCVGHELTKLWENQVQNVVELCRHNEGAHIHDFPIINLNLGPGVHETPGLHNLGGHPHSHHAHLGPPLPMGFLPESILNLGSPGLTYVTNDILGSSLGGGGRYKRQLNQASTRTNTENYVLNLVRGENHVRDKIANVSCVLRNLNVIDERGDLQTALAIQATSQLPIDGRLKQDMVEGAKECAKFTNCIPPSRSTLIPFALKRACLYLRCMQLKRQIACVKKDIRENISKSLPNTIQGSQGVEEITQRMLEVLMAEDINELETLLL